jgi:hypothetical protein
LLSQTTVSGEMCDITLTGASVVLARAVDVAPGTGLDLSFRLPSGLAIRTGAVLRGLRKIESTGAWQLRLTFRDLRPEARALLESYVASTAALAPGDQPSIEARLVAKYSARWDDAGRLRITLRGLVTRDEAQALTHLVRDTVMRTSARRLRVELDVTDLNVCSHEVMAELRACLEALGKRSELLGLLVGSNSIAHAQVLRSVREAGLADEIFCADDLTQAAEIWRQLEK